MANNRIDKINVGGADYDLGSTNFVFDTYAEYQAAYSAGDIPVGSVVYIKEGSTDNTITALQVVYNNGTVKGALDELNNELTDYTTTAETVIGTYNGNPVYRKRYVGANMSVTSSTIADNTLTTSTVDRVLDLKGLIKTEYGWNNNLDDGTHVAKIELGGAGLNVAISGVTATDWNLEVVYIKA